MENAKLLQMIEELQIKINDLENRGVRNTGFWNRAFSKMHVLAGVFLSAMITSAVLYAADIIEFIDGTTISAEDVNSNFTDLDARLKVIESTFAGVTRANNVIRFSGVNVQIVSGSGTTSGAVNGFGNLIVGYNELRGSGDVRTGSHNIIVGSNHNYSSFGGFVAGLNHNIYGQYSSISGGNRNTISGNYASVSGGYYNTASGQYSSVSGGSGNAASGQYSSVSGGDGNIASGNNSSVSGGSGNAASNIHSSVSGGYGNIASGNNSSVSGGNRNTISGNFASVSGGYGNTASGQYSSVSGGYNNTASHYYSSICGGNGNTTTANDQVRP